jgi:hypothetical protein
MFALALLTAGVRTADACSVVAGFPGSVSDRYTRSEIVFVGTVQSVIQDRSVYGDYRIQFETSKVYKGDFDHAVIVMAAGSSAACGYDDAYEVFKKGTVWAIYADGSLRTSGVVGNTQYQSVTEAEAELDAVAQKPNICTMQYAPVCGRKDTGIRCVTTPCNSYEEKTYGNSCMLRADEAEYLHEGECRVESGGDTGPAGGGTSGSVGGSVGGSVSGGSGSGLPQPDDILKPVATTSGEGTPDDKAIPEPPSRWTRFWQRVMNALVFWK